MLLGAEIKVTYQVNQKQEDQEYTVEVFVFFPKELESHEIGFYHNLWTTVKLHPPEVKLSFPVSQCVGDPHSINYCC